MKVAFFLPVNILGGAEVQVANLIKNFSPKVIPYVLYRQKEMKGFAESTGATSYLVHSPANLAAALKSIHPDIFSFYHAPEAFHALNRMTGWRPKTYEVIHNRRGWDGDSASIPKNHTDMVVCVSPSADAYFKSKVPNFPTRIIPNGIDQTVFFPRPEKKPKRTTPLGGFSGRLVDGDGKGVPDLIRLIGELPVDFELVGKDYSGIADLVAKEGYTNITVYPHTDKISEFYHKWDFFVSRSPAEGFGLSIAEALTCGLPSIIYDCGGICHYLEHGKHAFIEKNDEAMQRRILDVARGNHSLDPTSIDFSAKKMAAAYEEMYAELLSKKDEGSPQPRKQWPVKQNSVKTILKDSEVVHHKRQLSLPESIRRLGVVPDSWHGIKRSLSSFTDHRIDPDSAVEAIHSCRPEVVVFGGFDERWAPCLVAAKSVKAKIILTWHGTLLLHAFDEEVRKCFNAALSHKKMFDHIASPHYGMSQTMSALGAKTSYLPNVVDHEIEMSPKEAGICLGIFGSGRAWKNTETQVAGASLVPEAKVFVQNRRADWALAGRTRIMPYQSDPSKHYADLGRMTLNLSVSVTETFSYHVIESFLAGTPVIFSRMIPFISRLVDDVPEAKCCCIDAIDNPWEIAFAIKQAISSDKLYEEIRQKGRRFMLKINEEHRAAQQHVLRTWGISDADK